MVKRMRSRDSEASAPENAGILFLQVKNAAAQQWFAGRGEIAGHIQNQINTSQIQASFTFPVNLQISLEVNIESTRATR